MHQAHNISWASLSSNLVFINENRRITPHRTDLFPRELPTQGKSLNHFANTLASTIREFSATERAKYPAKFSAPTEGLVFSDALLSQYGDLPHYSNSVTVNNQRLENWLERAVYYDDGQSHSPSYSNSQGDLADVVKILLAENELETLLMLANHPRIPLQNLHSLGWGHSFGWNHQRDWALQSYIFFNVLLSKPELLENGRYKTMAGYKNTILHVTGSGDYDAQAYPHREFFWGSNLKTSRNVFVPVDELDPLADPEKLHEYLKMCFRLLYQYDVLAQESGVRVHWGSEIAGTVSSL
ncbi:hypothetical protein C8F01DRAFT_1019723, partial [Mycena amicta]